MNAESIKLVVDMIQSLGAGGKEAFVWYMLCSQVFPYVVGLVLGLTAMVCVKQVLSQLAVRNEADVFLQSIRDQNGIGSRGYMTASELRETCALISRSISKAKETK